VGGAASCAPRAHGGFWVRPAYGVGAMACVRVGVMGSGSAGIGGDRAPRLGQTACSMTQNHRSPKSIHGEEYRGSIRAIPLTRWCHEGLRAGVGEQTMIRGTRVHDRVPRPGVRPRGRGGQAGPAAADAHIENQNPGH